MDHEKQVTYDQLVGLVKDLLDMPCPNDEDGYLYQRKSVYEKMGKVLRKLGYDEY